MAADKADSVMALFAPRSEDEARRAAVAAQFAALAALADATATQPVAAREAALLAAVTRLSTLARGPTPIAMADFERVMMQWGLTPLFALVDGGMALAGGRQVFSPRLYASLVGVVKLTMNSHFAMPPAVYAWLVRTVTARVAAVVVPALAEKHDLELFRELRRRWEDHKLVTEFLRCLFKGLDDGNVALDAANVRSAVTDYGGGAVVRTHATVTSACIVAFKEAAFDALRDNIGGTVLRFIAAERAGGAIDRDEVRSILELFVAMSACTRRNDFASRRDVEAITRASTAAGAAAATPLLPTDIYVAGFEVPFLAASAAWLRGRGNELAVLPVAEFAAAAGALIAEEEGRVTALMHHGTLPQLRALLVTHLLAPHAAAALARREGGLAALLRRGADAAPAVGTVYRVLSRVPGLSRAIADVLRVYLIDAGRALCSDRCTRMRAAIDGAPPPAAATATGDAGASPAGGGGGGGGGGAGSRAAPTKRRKPDADDPVFIGGLVELHTTAAALVREQCDDDRDCWRAVKEAMDDLMNARLALEDDDSVAELGIPSTLDSYVAYLDSILAGRAVVRGVKLAGCDVDAAWKAALALFPSLHEKDVFRDAFRLSLAKRLLNGKSESLDAERAVVSELKVHAGAQFHQVERMINNFMSQPDWTAALAGVERARAAASPPPPALEFLPRVLDKAAWPTFSALERLVVPRDVAWYLTAFTTQYTAAQSHRRLDWQHSLGTADVVFNMGAGAAGSPAPKDCRLTCSTLQMFVLLAFNDARTASLADLATRLALDTDRLRMVVAPLTADPRIKVPLLGIVGAAKPRVATDADVLFPNLDFATNGRRAYSVPRVDLEAAPAREKTVGDRKFVIDAALVRIMKARKELLFEEVIAEAIRQTTLFRPDVRDVRRRIEDLIQREYLERDGTNVALLRYVA